jgi:hypothetical protein
MKHKTTKELKITYNFVDSPDAEHRLQKAYDILFTAVWEDMKKEKDEQSGKNN